MRYDGVCQAKVVTGNPLLICGHRCTFSPVSEPPKADPQFNTKIRQDLDPLEFWCDLAEVLGRDRPQKADIPGLVSEVRDRLAVVVSEPVVDGEQEFQSRVDPWLITCFGFEIARNREERNHRFLEESLELVQSLGCTQSEAHQLVDYVFNRPKGEPAQEAGGVMVTLAALCLAQEINMHEAGEVELARIWTKVETIRAKQAAKPKHSPLPAAAIPSAPAPEAQHEFRNIAGPAFENTSFAMRCVRMINGRYCGQPRSALVHQVAAAHGPRLEDALTGEDMTNQRCGHCDGAIVWGINGYAHTDPNSTCIAFDGHDRSADQVAPEPPSMRAAKRLERDGRLVVFPNVDKGDPANTIRTVAAIIDSELKED